MERKKRRRACAIVLKEGRILSVKMEDPSTKRTFWVPPGGGVEPGESPAQTAARETWEETGVAVILFQDMSVVATYDFEFAGVIYVSTTDFILGVADPEPPKTPPFTARETIIVDEKWLPEEEALEEYEKAAPGIGVAVRGLLQKVR